jgi:hypothetical protein
MKHQAQDARRQKTAVFARGDAGWALPALGTAKRSANVTANRGLSDWSTNHLPLRVATRYSHAAASTKLVKLHKPIHSYETKGLHSLARLEPLGTHDGNGGRCTSPRGNNNVATDIDPKEDRVLVEIWRIAAATVMGYDENVKLVSPSVTSGSGTNNNVQGRTERDIPEAHDDSSSGTTLARYRRLVGMHARKTLSRILYDTAERVTRKRLEEQAGGRIQRVARRFLGRRRCGRLRRMQVIAAETLQRVWRGTVVRRCLQRRRLEDYTQKRTERQTLEAIKKIQRRFRNHVLEHQEWGRRLTALHENCMEEQSAEARSRSVLARAVSAWWQRTRWTRGPLELVRTAESTVIETSTLGTVQSLPQMCEVAGVIHSQAQLDGGDVEPPVMMLGNAASQVRTSREVFEQSWTRWERRDDGPSDRGRIEVIGIVSGNMQAESNHDSIMAVTPVKSTPGLTPPLQVPPLHHSPRDEDFPFMPCFHGELVRQMHAPPTPQYDAVVDPVEIPKPDSFFTLGMTDPNDSVRVDTIRDHGADDAGEISTTRCLQLRQTTLRRATRVLARFVSLHCLPISRFRLSTRHAAATRIQQLVRQRIARQQVALRRQLLFISLRSELETHWVAAEGALLASIFNLNESDADNQNDLHTREDAGDEDTDDADLVFHVDDEQGEPSVQPTAGPTWAEVLPTRSGRIPTGLRADFSRGGPVSSRAPSLGLWKWSWTSEQWEPRRDLFELAQSRHGNHKS